MQNEDAKSDRDKFYNTFSHSEGENVNEIEAITIEEDDFIGVCEAFLCIIKYSLPAAAMAISQAGIFLMNYLFLGYCTQNPAVTAAWGLGFTWINIMFKYVAFGLWDGMDWLISQAYGREEFHLWELYLNMLFFTSLIFL